MYLINLIIYDKIVIEFVENGERPRNLSHIGFIYTKQDRS
jgi:hypothetical protein